MCRSRFVTRLFFLFNLLCTNEKKKKKGRVTHCSLAAHSDCPSVSTYCDRTHTHTDTDTNTIEDSNLGEKIKIVK